MKLGKKGKENVRSAYREGKGGVCMPGRRERKGWVGLISVHAGLSEEKRVSKISSSVMGLFLSSTTTKREKSPASA